MNTKTGKEIFKDKYGIDYHTLIEIKQENPNHESGYYTQDFKILYHKETDKYFSLWNTPYKHYIYIKNIGFITEDLSITNYYKNKNK
jgi:hypothetical protein